MTDPTTPAPGERVEPAPPSRWQDIADRADVGLVRIDATGRVVDLNPAAARLLGSGMEALRGRDLRLLAEAGESGVVDEVLQHLRHGEGPIARRVRWVRRSGESVSTLSHFSKVCDLAGVLRAVTVVLLDIGQEAPAPADASEELRRAMEALRVSEDRYRTLFESIDEGFCVIEMLFDGERAIDYRFVECNPAFERHTGIRGAVGRRMREFAPEHEDHWFALYGEVARNGRPVRVVLPARSLDDRWYEVHAFPFGIAGQDRVAVLFDDITNRKRAEAALRDSEERFRCVANAAPSMLWSATANGETTWLSERWSEYTGQSNHVSRQERNTVIHPADRDAAAEAWKRALRGGHFEAELRLRRKDGEYRWFLVRANPSHDAGGKINGWYGSTTDIHDHKLAEAALRDMDRRKDEFLATLAHELRNPLAPLRNCLHILRVAEESEGGAAMVDVDRLRAVMERQVGQLVRLVDDLMEVSRITRGMVPLHVQTVTIEEVIERAVETSRPLIDAAHHALVLHLPPEPLPMRADPVRLSQVVSNLLNNAAKYTESGGRIELGARREDNEVVIIVRDNGLGIETDQIDRVFDLFSQAEHSIGRAAGGLGIGLTLVRSLVELHGGTVVARSGGLGRGSEFEVRLPLMDGEGHDSEDDTRVGTDTPPLRLRVLVVDDNREHSDSLALYLRVKGHAVRTAYDAASALTWVAGFAPDAVLLDIAMPGVDGLEVCRRLRASDEGGKLVIVAVTGFGQNEDRRRSEEAGFDAHLVKPVDPTVLVTLVDSLVRMKRRAR